MGSVLDFTKDHVLENGRVRLEPLAESHLTLLSHFSENEPEIWTYSLEQPASEEGMRAYIARALAARKEKKSYAFLVFDKQVNKAAGSTRLYDIDLTNQTCSLGYTWYGKGFQGTGINRHCKFLLFTWAFEKLGFERIEFRADAGNARSIHAIKMLGCKEEGVLRSHLLKPGGGRRDSAIFSLLKTEWHESVKAKLHKLTDEA